MATGQPQTSPDQRPATPAARKYEAGILAVVAVSLLLRVPSFFDPPWVNDEGTYFAVAQAMAHGFRLYSGIWENKPPGVYLMYSAVFHVVGPSLITVRLIAAAASVCIVVLTWRLGRVFTGRGPDLAAAMCVALLIEVPFLEGTTANAEIFVAVFAALGVLLGIRYEQPVLAGALLAAAMLFKSVAAFDAIAMGFWLLINRRDAFGPYVSGIVLVLTATTALALWAGILPAMVQSAVVYDLGYVGHANGGGVPWVLLVKVGALGTLTLLLRRAPFPFLWLVFAAAGALVSGRFFGHYAVQAFVPFALSLAVIVQNRPTLTRRLPAVLLLTFVLLASISAAVGWTLSASGHDSILARRLQWYANFVRLATGTESYAVYRSQVDDHVSRTIQVAHTLAELPPGRLLVWGNSPWVYVLSGRLPATPYTSSLRSPEVPGETASLRRSVEQGAAREIVILRPAAPPLGRAGRGLESLYRVVGSVEDVTIYALAGSVSRRASARATASVRSGTR